MADIDMQRKTGGGMGWMWGLVALLAVLLLVWWIWPDGDDDDLATLPVVEEPITPATTPEVVAGAPGVTIGDLLGNPSAYLDAPWANESVRVTEVPTDRGFWIEDQGQRLFVIINDGPMEQPKDINPGQELRIAQGILRDRTFLPQISGDPLDADTQTLAENQPIFLVVDESNIQILSQGTPQPGTTPAQTAPATGGS